MNIYTLNVGLDKDRIIAYAWAVPNTLVIIGLFSSGSNAWNDMVLWTAESKHFLQLFSNETGVSSPVALGRLILEIWFGVVAEGEPWDISLAGDIEENVLPPVPPLPCITEYTNGRWIMYRAPQYLARNLAAFISLAGGSLSSQRSGSGRCSFHCSSWKSNSLAIASDRGESKRSLDSVK